MIDNNSHIPVPFPAFDIDEKPIPPADWTKKIHGAEIIVKFTVTHQWLGSSANPASKKDNYYADIAEIRVLRPPRPPPTSPTKQPHNTDNNPEPSTSKQKRPRKNCTLSHIC